MVVAKNPDSVPVPAEPELDANGVDLAQIRAMLALSPEQRLRQVFEFAESLGSIRERNEDGPAR